MPAKQGCRRCPPAITNKLITSNRQYLGSTGSLESYLFTTLVDRRRQHCLMTRPNPDFEQSRAIEVIKLDDRFMTFPRTKIGLIEIVGIARRSPPENQRIGQKIITSNNRFQTVEIDIGQAVRGWPQMNSDIAAILESLDQALFAIAYVRPALDGWRL